MQNKTYIMAKLLLQALKREIPQQFWWKKVFFLGAKCVLGRIEDCG
jgi:hypothetical protein